MRKLFAPLAIALISAFSCEKAPEEIVVTSVSIDQDSPELIVGETLQMTATVTPSEATDQTITWTSSKKSVATITNTGLLTAIAEGRTTIKASAGGKTASCVVTVNKQFINVSSVTIDKSTLSIIRGESATLVATVKPDNATHKTVKWASSDSSVASVDSDGTVTAVATGHATIMAKVDEMQATCEVTVTVPVSSITLNKSTLTLYKGETETLVATVEPNDATDNTVTWTSSNPNMASVDSNGKVTAVSSGNVTIAAKAGGKSVTCAVTVIVPVESVSLNKTNLTLGEGESVSLQAKVNPKDATDKTVTWTSSNESVATVNQNGVINAIKEGTANIVAKAGDKEATCVIRVIKKVASISLDKENLTLFVGNTSTLTVTVIPEDATDKTVTWRSSDTSVATVENGVVKGIGVGITTIYATAGNATATCRILVVMDSANGVSASFHGGNYETIEDVVQPGGYLVFGVQNYSSETIHVVTVQWIDGKTGASTNTMSIDSEIASGDSQNWTIPIGDTGIYSPKARFVYTFKGESYTCEAEIIPL